MEQRASQSVQGFRLSPLQRRLWTRPEGNRAVAQAAVLVTGRLRPLALQAAAEAVVAGHEILRTTFQSPRGIKVPFQVVQEHLVPAWREVSLADVPPEEREGHIRRLLDEERDAGADADLESGPLLRLLVADLGVGRHALLITLPALCADSRTLRNLVQELLGACGLKPSREPEPLQYADVSEWQNDLFRHDSDDENVEAARDYWRRQEGGELPPLPGERPPAAGASFEPRSVRLDLTAELPALEAFSRADGVPLSSVLLGAWQILLWRLAGGDQVTTGVGFDGRRHAEMAEALGLFARRLPLRGRFDPRQSFREVVRQVAESVTEAARWQDYADWEEEGRDFREKVVYPAGFEFTDWPEEPLAGGGSSSLLELRVTLEPFRVELDCVRRDGGLAAELRYDAAVLFEASAQAMAQQLVALLRSALADPGRAIAELDLLGPAERDRLLAALNATEAPVAEVRSVHERFEQQVRCTPGATAAVFERDAATYEELNRSANRLAHHLRALGIGPEDRVAIGLERSLDALVAFLATLKAGAAFVPLDLSYPPERLTAMLQDAEVKVILRAGLEDGRLPDLGIPRVRLDDPELGSQSELDPLPVVEPENLAYVLFTSGSTGRPKGVAVEHRNLLHYLEGILRRLDLPSGSSFATVSTLAADLGNTAIYPALSTGGTLHLISQERASDPAELADYCGRHRIDCLKIVPSHLAALLSSERASELLPKRRLVLGGEALGWDLVRGIRKAAPDLPMLNHYGPTETTVGVLAAPVEEGAAAPDTASVPLGRPLPGSRVYVLDARLEPVPAGVPGQLHIGGGGVSRGYLGRPDATAERLIPDPFSGQSGARLYGTGDLVRFLPGDGIEFLGRVDQQVKIRGFRIELGEIEAVLQSHPGVQRAVVTVYERPAGKKHLAAYVVAQVRHDLTAASLRRFVSDRLPEPMHPGAYVFVKSLPLTANGKVDRRALPPPEEGTAEARFVAPRTPVEETLARIWCQVLTLDRVGVHDNFFDLGGDSIVSIQVLARTSQEGLCFTPQQLFRYQTIAELAALIAETATLRRVPVKAGEEAGDVYPASPMQRAMLFFAQLAPEAGIYLDQAVYTLCGPLDTGAFRRAWQEVVARHPALRTGFRWEGLDEPLQVVERQPELPWQEEDWRDLAFGEQRERLEAWLAADRRRGFDLGRAPLLRLFLVRTGDAVYRVGWTFHHIVLDGWSVARVLGEVSSLYRAFSRGREASLDPSRPYGEYIRWLEAQDAAAGRELWTRTLEGFTAPTPLPVRPGLPPAGESPHLEAAARLGAEPTRRLRALARQHRLTLNTMVQGAWALLLHRYSGEPDLVFGATVSGRPPELAGAESMVGLFINTLPVRARIDPGARLIPWLRGLQDEQVELRPYQYAPLVDIQGWSAVPRGLPLFESIVVFDNFPVDEVVGDLGEDIEVDPDFHFFNRTNFALSLASWPAPELPLELRYDSGRFERTAIERLLHHLAALLDGMSSSPEARLSELGLLAPPERHQILAEWNDTAASHGRDRSIVDAIEERAAGQPDEIAVVFGEERWTYRQVEEEANRLAHQLRALGVGRGDLVAVHLHRCAEMVPALLGILKSGAAYVPVEVSLPAARVSWLLSALEIRCAVTQGRRAAALAGLDLPRLEHLIRVEDRQSRQGFPATPPAFSPGPEDLAYIIFTSGSTGTPKGVMVRHQPVVNLIEWVNASFRMGREDRVLFITSLSFDLSVYDVFGMLSAGGSVRVASEEELGDPASLVRALEEEPITYWDSAPAALQQLAPFFPRTPGRSRLRLVFLSGDWVPLSLPDQVRAAFPEARVVALGGATEATVWSNFFPVGKVEPGWVSIPYGRPIRNARYHVLDGHLDPCPVGVAGDLYIGGECLALGYVQEPVLTAGKFVPDGCGGGRGARLYRTGDRARYWDDGLLEFLGRLDTQVKIRGFRIELGEIEAALGEHPEVREAVVMVREDVPGDRRLAAYVVPRDGAGLEAGELRAHLRERLPEPMVPQAFVFLEAMPVTANGKLDRKALPAPERPRAEDGEGFVAPRNAVEELLAAAWAELLGADRVGAHDNFFTLGGHSLIATRLVARIREAFGVELTLRRLFDGPTVAEVAEAVSEAIQAGARLVSPPVERIPREGDLPLSFAQERLWFLDQLEPGSPAYNMPAAVRFEGRLDPAVLDGSLGEIVARHESLRTSFHLAGGQPVQRIAPPRPFRLPQVDLEGLPDGRGETEALRLAGEEARRPFDLARGPLLRGTLLRLGREDHILLLNLHHIVSDGWSIGVMVRELAALYSAFAGQRPSSLPPLPIQYGDFAAWQREWMRDDVLASLLAHWRERLKGAPLVLELPADRPHPPVPSGRGGRRMARIPSHRLAAVAALSRREGVTLYMVLLAAFCSLLYRITGRDDLLLGTDVANRNRTETEDLIGFFVNQLVLRADLSGDPSLRRLLPRIRETTLDAYAHQDLPFNRLVEELQPERDLSRAPVFQVVFVLQNVPVASLELPGLTLRPFQADGGTAKLDLMIEAVETASGLLLRAEYSADLFNPTTVDRLLGHFDVLLGSAIAAPEVRLSRLPLLSEAERQQLAHEWNDSTALFSGHGATFPDLFETLAAARPEEIAAICGNERITYGELDRRAGHLSRVLAAEGIRRDVVVALLVDRGLDFLVAVLAIFKAGAAYLPLDPLHPRRRLARLVGGSDARLALAGRRLVPTLAEALEELPAATRPPLRTLEELFAEADPNEVPPGRPEPGGLAYVIYTSGSTGAPKGALVEHGGMLNHLWAKVSALDLGAADLVAQTASQCFDISVWQLLAVLLVGGRVEIFPDEVSHDPVRLFSEVEDRGITVLETVPSLLRPALEELEARGGSRPALASLRWLIPTGEALPAELCRRWLQLYPAVPLLNAYGPTECSDDVTHHPIRPGGEPVQASAPIGRPVPNLRLYVLDRGMEPLPAGVPGELFVGGTGVGRGYLRDGGRTAQSFVPDPFASGPGARLYRTGDLARLQADGVIEFLGRIDHQVKIRGHRIELGEIESVLSEHPLLSAATVLAREDVPGDPRLVAYVVPRPETSAGRRDLELGQELASLRELLVSRLPEVMVPSSFVVLEALPLTPNGKLDRQALPAPERIRTVVEAGFVAPRTEEEGLLANIWSDLLGIERIGVQDNFFDLGGHSLLATSLLARIRESFAVDLPLRALFEAPTVEGVSAAIERARARGLGVATPRITPVKRESRRLKRTDLG